MYLVKWSSFSKSYELSGPSFLPGLRINAMKDSRKITTTTTTTKKFLSLQKQQQQQHWQQQQSSSILFLFTNNNNNNNNSSMPFTFWIVRWNELRNKINQFLHFFSLSISFVRVCPSSHTTFSHIVYRRPSLFAGVTFWKLWCQFVLNFNQNSLKNRQ